MIKNISKTLSRLAAVQSCFQSFFDDKSLKNLEKEFNEYRFKKKLDKNNLNLNYNKIFFNDLILNIENFKVRYNVNKFFSDFINIKRPYERLDIITKAILIVGSSEILENSNIKKSIIINEYVEIAKSFLNKPEVSLINAILDKVYESKEKN